MAARVQPRQLAFALPHAESLTRDNFLEGPANAAGLALIDGWPEWPNRVMLLVGPEGCGKSHLAAIWAEQAGARSISAHALTAAAVPGALATGALVVEDLRSGDVDERALFHLMNLAREDEAFVLITAREPASAFEVELRDLRSRLRAVPAVTLLPPDDQLFRALDRQILRGPPAHDRRGRGELSRHPDRAILCGRASDRRTAGQRSAAARPPGDPGAGGRIAPQRLTLRPCAILTVPRPGTSMSLKRHRDNTCSAAHLPGTARASRRIGPNLDGIRTSYCN